MKNLSKKLLRTFAACCLLSGNTSAFADFRVWANSEGKEIKAEFVGQDEVKVKFKLADGKLVVIDKASLSPRDIEFLRTMPSEGLTGRDEGRSNGAPFDLWRQTKFEVTPSHLGVGSPIFKKTLTSDHFHIVATNLVNDDLLKLYAESGERLFAQIATGWDSFQKYAAGKRMVVFLAENAEEYGSLHAWLYANTDIGIPYAWRWNSIECGRFRDPTQKDLAVLPCYRTFTLSSKDAHSKIVKWSPRIHFLAASLIFSFLDGVPYSTGESNLSLLVVGMAYQIEYKICGRITTMVNSEVGSVESKNWVDLIKRNVRDPAKRPDLNSFLKLTPNNAAEDGFATAFSLSEYLYSDSSKLRSFQGLLDTIRKNRKMTSANEMGRALGCSSADELNLKWLYFLQSSSFR